MFHHFQRHSKIAHGTSGLCWCLDFELFPLLFCMTTLQVPSFKVRSEFLSSQHLSSQLPLTQSSLYYHVKKGPIVDINSNFQWVSVRLTAKCGSKSTQSVPPKPEISSALGRWSTTACTGTPLPRPLEPLPRALRAPRPRVWTPRPRPGERIPLLAAWANKNRDEKKSNRAPITTHYQSC